MNLGFLTETSMNALEFCNIGKQFGSFTALDDVSLQIPQGQFCALLGHNGAGKTTLISCLSGAVRPTTGHIKVLETDINDDPVFAKTKVGVVNQEVTFDPFFTPWEVLKMQRGYFGMSRKDDYLHWLLEKLSLTDKKEARGRNLSGGMKRRLMIAKALAHEPEILILDEPTAGVDVELRQSLWEFITELREQKQMTIVLTTHYLEEAEALADHIAIIDHGKITINEPMTQVMKRSHRTLHLTFSDGTQKSEILQPDTSIREIVTNCPKIKDIHIEEPKLEDIFLSLTTK